MGDAKRVLLSAYEAALQAIDAESTTAAAVGRADLGAPIRLLAIGKAAAGMARGAAAAVRHGTIRAGLVVSDRSDEVPDGMDLIVGSHPIPDEASAAAGEAVLRFVADGSDDETLLVLLSGGGSAIAEVPVPGWSVEQIATLSRRLMAAATPIEDLNTVRRHLSVLKNGGVLRVANSATAHSILISDVIDGPASAIASGPTLTDHTTAADAAAIVRERLDEHLGDLPDPPQPALGHSWEVIGNAATAATAAAAYLDCTIDSTALRGEARDEAVALIRRCGAGSTLVAAGETTVTVSGDGIGGRNQEAALAAAIEIEGQAVTFAALGTDGIDGLTDAAGAIVDGSTAERLRDLGVDPIAALANNDSATALRASGDQVIAGPSGTNVGDLWIVARS